MKAKNKNQKRLKNSNDRRFWKIRTNEVIIEHYWEGDWTWKHNMPNYKYRRYKSWKYNIKTQYK